MEIMKTINWIGENYENILNSIVVVMGAMGVILETINRFIPTKNEDSAMTKLANFFVKGGGLVKKLMDYLKIPNVKKK